MKNALEDISYGVYIVTATDGEKHNGQIANSVIQVTNTPPQLAVCISKQNLTHEYISKTGIFGMSVLEKETSMLFMGPWGFKSGRTTDKFHGVNYKDGKTGVRLVADNSLSVMEAKVVSKLDVGTHTIFVGKIVNSEVLKDGEVLTYEYYHREKKGKAPKTAPTYRQEA